MEIYAWAYMIIHLLIILISILKQQDEISALLSFVLMIPFYNHVLDIL